MAKDETKRVSPSVIAEDDKVVTAVNTLSDYAPANPAYTKALLNAADEELDEAIELERQAQNAFKAAKDRVTAAQWKRHNIVLGCRTQVRAQYGDSSDQAQSVGLKKKTEYKNRNRTAKTP